MQSYNAMHGTNFSISDITKLTADDLGIAETLKYLYIMTYSFPCVDLSNAGMQQGMAKGSGTRSGLLWEVERLLIECTELPQILLMENVPAVMRSKNETHFNEWLNFLSGLGYKSYYRCLNAKNYGIPQSRDRCFMVSVLGDYEYKFPMRQQLRLRLKDLLEDEVDEKFYLTDGKIEWIKNSLFQSQKTRIQDMDGICKTLCARDYKDPTCVEIPIEIKCRRIGKLRTGKWDKAPDIAKRIYDAYGISPTITTMGGGNLHPKIVDPQGRKNKKLKPLEICPTLRAQIHGNPPQVIEPQIMAMRGREPNVLSLKRTEYGKQIRKQYERGEIAEKRKNIQRLEPRNDGLTNTLTTVQKDNLLLQNTRIRKLTPKECWRLMGFDDEDFERAKVSGISNSQLYKQAGNSICVDVLVAIFRELFTNYY